MLIGVLIICTPPNQLYICKAQVSISPPEGPPARPVVVALPHTVTYPDGWSVEVTLLTKYVLDDGEDTIDLRHAIKALRNVTE